MTEDTQVAKRSSVLPRILVTGRDGQVGRELLRVLSSLGTVVACNREELDLADHNAIRRVVEHVDPDFVINAAAYTAVDQAESDRSTAFAVNAEGPGVLAREAARVGARFVHYSTDYIYDGGKGAPYLEDDAPNPLNVYGASKLAGERLVLQENKDALIFRTSWVYATHGKNFVLTIKRLAEERNELRVVDDQFGAPTSARLIADVTTRILCSWIDGATPEHSVYHLTASGVASWFNLARSVVEIVFGVNPRPLVTAVTSDQFPTLAARPMYSVLDCTRLEQEFSIVLPDWDTELKNVLSTVLASYQRTA